MGLFFSSFLRTGVATILAFGIERRVNSFANWAFLIQIQQPLHSIVRRLGLKTFWKNPENKHKVNSVFWGHLPFLAFCRRLSVV